MKVPGSGNRKAKVAFVGEGPGKWEDQKGRAFVGASGKLLWQFAAKYMGIKRPEVWTTNLSKERLVDAKGKDRAPTNEERKRLAPELRKELVGIGVQYVVAFGRHAAQALLRRPVQMEASHGLPFRAKEGYVVIPVFHPASGLHQEKMLPYTAVGMMLAAEVIQGKGPQPFLNPVPQDRKYIVGLPEKLPQGKEIIGVDTEGLKKNPWTVQVSWESRVAYLVDVRKKKLLERLRSWMVNGKELIFVLHYALHDLKVLLKLDIDLLPAFDEGRVKDTLVFAAARPAEPGELKALAERHLRLPVKRYEEIVAPVREKKIVEWIFDTALNEELPWPIPEGRAHSLPRRLLNITKPSKAAEPRSTWSRWSDKKFKAIRKAVEKVAGAPPELSIDDLGEDFKDYACADPDMTRSVYLLLKHKSTNDGLMPGIEADHAALPLIERMERSGMGFSMPRWKAHMGRLEEIKEDTQAAAAMLTDGEVVNPSASDQVQKWCVNTMHFPLTRMTKTKTRESTDDDALKSIRGAHPAINYFIEYRAAVKQIGICRGLPDYIDDDGRVRYRFNYGKVRTGRRSMGSKDEDEPNLLAFPKRGPLGKSARSMFVAGEGMLFGSCDASQIELRVAAALSQDKEMMGAYRRGDDLHALTAVRMTGCSWEEAQNNDDIRIPWKTANFALLYLASAETLHKTYVAEGITQFSVEDCEKIRKDWFKLYNGVEAFFKQCIAQARKTGYISTPFGRKRMLPCIDLEGEGYPMGMLREGDERKACNTPIQGGAFELIKRAEARIAQILRVERDWFTPVLEIHDDLMFEFEGRFEENVRERVRTAMTADSPFRGVVLEADWKSGPSWGELSKEVKVKKTIKKNKSR